MAARTVLAAGRVGITVLGWLIVSVRLGVYVAVTGNFDETYRPLTAVMALLLWADVTSLALLAGIALAAQLEAARADQTDPMLAHIDEDGIPGERGETSPDRPSVEPLLNILANQHSIATPWLDRQP